MAECVRVCECVTKKTPSKKKKGNTGCRSTECRRRARAHVVVLHFTACLLHVSAVAENHAAAPPEK